MSSQLRRFISFAFAAADLLIEVGAAGEIRFALGAAMSFTNRHDHDLVGSTWLELFDPADHLFHSGYGVGTGITGTLRTTAGANGGRRIRGDIGTPCCSQRLPIDGPSGVVVVRADSAADG